MLGSAGCYPALVVLLYLFLALWTPHFDKPGGFEEGKSQLFKRLHHLITDEANADDARIVRPNNDLCAQNAWCRRTYAYENRGRRSRTWRTKKLSVVCSQWRHFGEIHVTPTWCYSSPVVYRIKALRFMVVRAFFAHGVP